MKKELLFGGIISKALNHIVTVIGITIFGYLTWYSFRYTYNFVPDYHEMFVIEKDNLFLHVVALVVCTAAVCIFECFKETLREDRKRKIEKSFPIVVMLITAVFGVWWVSVVHAQPCTDQKWVIEGTYSLMEGNYETLKPDQYFGMHSYQLNLAVVFRFFFTLCRVKDYHVIQYCNVVCVPIIILAGYKIVENLTEKGRGVIFYCLLALSCLPLIFYTPFVYGEIFSVMAGVVFVWFLIEVLKNGRKFLLFPTMLSSVFGVLTRGNFWIVIIAGGIVLAVYGIKRKDRMLLILLILTIIAPLGTQKGIEKVYERRSGIKLDEGMPLISTIAMGIHDEGTQPAGWSNMHNYYAYTLNDYNTEKAAEFSKAYIRARVETFRDGRADWKEYFKEKLLTQWEEPTWQSLLANHDFAEEPGPFIESVYYGEVKRGILSFLNEYQWLLYVGTCLFFWYCWKRKKPFYMLLPEVILIGGVLFSLLWEAKTRYSFPYMVYMLPCAAIGLTWLSECLGMAVDKRKCAGD